MIQPVERIKDRDADHMVDIPVPPVVEENRCSCAGGGEVGPTGTRAMTDQRAACGGSSSSRLLKISLRW